MKIYIFSPRATSKWVRRGLNGRSDAVQGVSPWFAPEIQGTNQTVEFTLPLPDDRKSEPRARAATNAEWAVASPALETDGIILSGTQVFWSCFSSLLFVGLVLWAILKLWVYEEQAS